MTSSPSPQIAIVGSGPSGCYAAQALLRSLPQAEITIFDRLVSPFGLIRYGVAADHQHTKAITRQFERLFASPGVRFAGGIEVGIDIELPELLDAFDAVVLATGIAEDRALSIPGSELPGVYGAGALIQSLNAHPDAASALPPLGDNVVVIGAGNVALDILRFLVKAESDYLGSDVADDALEAYLRSPAARVTVASRSVAAAAKGDPQMLRELALLPRANYSLIGAPLDAGESSDRTSEARIAALQLLVADDRGSFPGPDVTLGFGLVPRRIVGEGDGDAARVTAVEFDSPDGVVSVPATSVVTAVGFSASGPLAHLLSSPGETGRLSPGLYRTGWAKRGSRGAIPENRACAKSVAEEVAADLAAAPERSGSAARGFDALNASVRDRAVSFDSWLHLDLHEQMAAPEGRVRRKVADLALMRSIAQDGGASGATTSQKGHHS
ncbi:FAD-dependent oxidoreductase [Leucobacter sp. USHLN153]|uniref:FAD-dependent oxidoreductase n=1 Tax=Leucobacter sp. USHLN153 TaxID=3081268 RepID=UPI00301ABA56